MSETGSPNRIEFAVIGSTTSPRFGNRRDYSPFLASIVLWSIFKLAALAVASIAKG